MHIEYSGFTDKETVIELKGAKMLLPDFASGKNPSFLLNDGMAVEINDDCIGKLIEWNREHVYKEDLINYIQDIKEGSVEPPEGTTAELIQNNFDEILEYYFNCRDDSEDWQNNIYKTIQTFIDWNM